MKNATKMYVLKCNNHEMIANNFLELIEKIDVFENKLIFNRDKINILCFDKNGLLIHEMIANKFAIERFSMCIIENYDFAILTYDDDEGFIRKHIVYDDMQLHNACLIYYDSFDNDHHFLNVEKYQMNRLIVKQNIKFDNMNIVCEIDKTDYI